MWIDTYIPLNTKAIHAFIQSNLHTVQILAQSDTRPQWWSEC